MKTSLFLISLIITQVALAGLQKEKSTCYVGNQKVSESTSTILTDGKTESRSSIIKMIHPKTNEITTMQQLVISEIEKTESLEQRKTSGTYVTLSKKNLETVSVVKIESVDSYLIEGNKKTLIKSVIDGQELNLYTVDTQVQINQKLKIYTSVLKNKAEESENLKSNYVCRIEIL